MTAAEARKTRLTLWKDLLTDVGGTPGIHDTLYVTVRKVLIALGGSPGLHDSFRNMGKAILAINPLVYAANGKYNGHLLPQSGKALAWGTDHENASPSLSGIAIGEPTAGVAIGDADANVAIGKP